MDVELNSKALRRIEDELGLETDSINRINVDINADLDKVEESYENAIREVIKGLRQIYSDNFKEPYQYEEDFDQVDLKKLLDNDIEAW